MKNFFKKEDKGLTPIDQFIQREKMDEKMTVPEMIKTPTKFANPLGRKIDEFLVWYYRNFIKGSGTEQIEYDGVKKMKDLIEKVAVWYELRYPDYEINQILPCMGKENKRINDIMFNNNSALKNTNIPAVNWADFYNKEVLLESLPWKEEHYFKSLSHDRVIYVDCQAKEATFYITGDDHIEISENMEKLSNGKASDKEFEGLSLKEAKDLLKRKEIILSKDNELDRTINMIECRKKLKESLQDCIMYRIIERGENRIGPRRAFLFAQEFDRNIDIPMTYGIDMTDPGLSIFINEYLKAGGSKELLCDLNYFFRMKRNEQPELVTIEEVIKRKNYNEKEFYTEKENELHQRFVKTLEMQKQKI